MAKTKAIKKPVLKKTPKAKKPAKKTAFNFGANDKKSKRSGKG